VSHKGWHSRGYLPHFDSAETVQFVTFRLADSLPRVIAEALARLPDNLAEPDHKLDNCLGSCWLSLGAIVRSWKSFTANRANQALGRGGPFWHHS
jgi:hypothetical protein